MVCVDFKLLIMKLLFGIILLSITLRLSAPDRHELIIFQSEAIKSYNELWEAVCFVESSSDPSVKIIDKNGQYSVGIAQIQLSRVEDFDKQSGKNYTLDDMHCPVKAKEVFMFYINPNFEITARTWNGGPKGMEKESTSEYWERVKVLL